MYQTILISIVILAALEQLYETFVLGQRKEKGVLKGEKWTIYAMGIIHAFMFFSTLLEYFITKKSLNLTISFIGLLLYIFGVFGRYWSIYTLGKLWSIHIEIREKHEIIKRGPYLFMRHPAYFFLFLKVPSVPLILNSYYTFCLVLITYCPLVFIRLYYEEIELFKKFKKSYIKYRKEKWSLLPFKKVKVSKNLASTKFKWLRKIINRW